MIKHEENWNDNALLAWNQWKAICSICGCPPEQQKILMVEVSRAFQKKLHAVIGNQLDTLFSVNHQVGSIEKDNEESDVLPSQSGRLPTDSMFYNTDDSSYTNAEGECKGHIEFEDEDCEQESVVKDKPENEQDNTSDPTGRKYDWRVNWAHEFDCGIIEKANSPSSPKNYKDHTWECIMRSKDPPLKVIRGQLLGPLGIINEIAERFLRSNYPQIWEKLISLQIPISSDEDDSGTLEDTIPYKVVASRYNSLDKSEEEYLQKSFWKLFTNDNAAIFLVYLTDFSPLFSQKISIATPELQNYVGFSAISSLYDRLNNVILPKIQALPKECLQVMTIPGASDFLIFLMIEQIKPEKRALPLLQRVIEEISNSTGEETENE